jgi:hypothetical protein
MGRLFDGIVSITESVSIPISKDRQQWSLSLPAGIREFTSEMIFQNIENNINNSDVKFIVDQRNRLFLTLNNLKNKYLEFNICKKFHNTLIMLYMKLQREQVEKGLY